jgi:hypothetical protein
LFIGWSSTKLSFFVQYGIQDGGYGMTWFNIGPYGEIFFKRHLGQLKLNLETELRRNMFGASGERYRLLRASGS